jgi:glycine/D-amino acid oxidase-like deaminating enzyme
MSLTNNFDFIVIGGGVMGASTAYHLAARGYKNVLLLEKEEFFGQGATGRCAGGVRYQFATEINVRLSMASLPMLERFEEEIGQVIDYRKCGYLFILSNEKDAETFKRNVSMQNRLGIQTEWLTGDEVRRRLPMMRLEDIIAGTLNPEDGLVDPNSVVMGYISAAQRLGVKTLTNSSVIGIQVRGNHVVSVKTPESEYHSPIIVDATGPWAGVTSQLAGVQVPITPIRRQWLTTTALPGIPDDFPFVLDFAQSLYFHREGPGLLTGMSNPNQIPGFDQNTDPDWELIHMEAAIARLPLIEKAGLVSKLAGLYEMTPDAHPIFGKTPVEGFFMVAGFSGHGFMHGPIAGKLMAEIILDGRASTLDVSMLDLARFSEDRLIYEYNVV